MKIPRRRALEAAGWLIGLEAALAPTNALAQEGIAGFGAEASRIQALMVFIQDALPVM